MGKQQKGKGKKRKRGWHRSKRSAKHFDSSLKKLEQGENADSQKQ